MPCRSEHLSNIFALRLDSPEQSQQENPALHPLAPVRSKSIRRKMVNSGDLRPGAKWFQRVDLDLAEPEVSLNRRAIYKHSGQSAGMT